MSYYRVLAMDYDGTLTEGRGRSSPCWRRSARRGSGSGIKGILVTGRILSNLREGFPDVDEHFDAAVAENGAVLSRGAGR